MKIAIVGAGISGLATAYFLQPQHDVTVFEAAQQPGGHTHTVRIDTAEETHDVDMGFIVFNDRNYPNFERLLAGLGVASQQSEMSFSVSDGIGAFEYSSRSLNALFADRRQLVSSRFYRMLADVPRFQRAARELLRDGNDESSLLDWLSQRRFTHDFIERLLFPQVSAVWSAEPASLWRFPARFLARFFDNHGMLSLHDRPSWRTVTGGSARYVEALTRSLDQPVRLGAPVDSVVREARYVAIKTRGAQPELFDHVVIATHSDQALQLLPDATAREREILGAIPYQRNEVVLHTDQRVLPRRRRAWASWNYHLLSDPSERSTVTYHMNRLQNLESSDEFCVTLNLTERVDPNKILRKIDFAHPVYTPEGVSAQQRVSEISGTWRTHFCGAYWGWGFHEDGVNSALRVTDEFAGQA